MPTRSGLGDPDVTAIVWFLGFVAITLGITWWAARRTRTANDFFAAGGSVSAGMGVRSVQASSSGCAVRGSGKGRGRFLSVTMSPWARRIRYILDTDAT